MEERLLTIDNLNVSYDRPILKDLSLHIDNVVRPGMNQGQVVALLGPSGIGKTQLFRCIAGLQTPTSGSVTLNGTEQKVQAGQVGVVQQHYPLLNHRTIISNLKLAAREFSDAKERSLQMLERFGMLDKQNNYPGELSGGQRQRVAIMQQLLCSTHFLLMDEPFSGLDIIAKDEVSKLIHEVSVADELNTIILTTHDIDAALAVADTLWILGRDRNEKGESTGATIKAMYNLIEMDLAWHEDVRKRPNYDPLMKELTSLFKTL
jgi:ABC-type nitrate/sulfonate/bicarbonate transport system ATPase subunit